jgi:hypothetical protein
VKARRRLGRIAFGRIAAHEERHRHIANHEPDALGTPFKATAAPSGTSVLYLRLSFDMDRTKR